MSDAPEATSSAAPDETKKSVILVSYPKIVFLWPAFVTALIAGIYSLFTGGDPTTGDVIVAWTFLIVLSINLVVLSFDFPRTTSLVVFFGVSALVLLLVLGAIKYPEVLPTITGWLSGIRPAANATFYFLFFGVLAVIYIGVAINVRFDYWEVRPNELLHHHGILSDLKRFPAPQLRIDKEINDIFEYLLLGSGRLILHPSNERRAIVLENVFFISRKEKEITRMLGALQVRIRKDNP